MPTLRFEKKANGMIGNFAYFSAKRKGMIKAKPTTNNVTTTAEFHEYWTPPHVNANNMGTTIAKIKIVPIISNCLKVVLDFFLPFFVIQRIQLYMQQFQ